MSTSMPATHGRNEARCNIAPRRRNRPPTTTTTKAIFSIFNIFGYVDQTPQGAYTLAAGGGGGGGGTSSQKPAFGQNSPVDVADSLPAYVEAVHAANPAINSWMLIGGGKVPEPVTSNPSENPYAIVAAARPAMIDPAGAEKISVVQAFEERLSVPHRFEMFGDQMDGWMAARADLRDFRVREEDLRGYRTAFTHLPGSDVGD
ncbi:hypothetical protein BO82DRAFT_407212 [Aspergillus uvarum CBS 121591]|uniref:Uncharacterized protein n=1 Tax=Aspergillus uvarum CBS 121591 TaxID=1448315 RepID=A0A319BY38_9EURO|nr:hypothetical protein BO82DRAFT_407212 [Aspergillus uvarum CBS 121591]PYH76340.1 hypothetical protein BO82DRAFT_407212 [Aspergillus uvarum CBS 121591]